MKLSRIDMFWGCLLIAVGIGFFGDSLHLWNFEFFFCGWWTLFIIVPSLCNILEENTRIWGEAFECYRVIRRRTPVII